MQVVFINTPSGVPTSMRQVFLKIDEGYKLLTIFAEKLNYSCSAWF